MISESFSFYLLLLVQCLPPLFQWKNTQTLIMPPLPTPLEFQSSHNQETSKAALNLLPGVQLIATKNWRQKGQTFMMFPWRVNEFKIFLRLGGIRNSDVTNLNFWVITFFFVGFKASPSLHANESKASLRVSQRELCGVPPCTQNLLLYLLLLPIVCLNIENTDNCRNIDLYSFPNCCSQFQ